ncbi:MAG TPA: glycosyl transferase, partial [Chitinophagaceae bacterium]
YKRPIVSVWGNTSPVFGKAPYYGSQQVSNDIFQNSKLGCRPCSDKGFGKCPRGHFKCMESIAVADVLDAVKRKL